MAGFTAAGFILSSPLGCRQTRHGAAKKGDTAKSRTGKSRRQASVEFGKPPKQIWVKVCANPSYRQFDVPAFIDKDRDTVHYVAPEATRATSFPTPSSRFIDNV